MLVLNLQIIKDPQIKDETIMLVFRIMHAIEVPDIEKLLKSQSLRKDKEVSSPSKKAREKIIDDGEDPLIGPSRKAPKDPPKPANTITTTEETKSSSNDKDKEKNKITEDDPKNHTKIIFHKAR